MRPIIAQGFCVEAFFKAMMLEDRAWAEKSSHSAEDVVIKVWDLWGSWYFHGRVLQMKEQCGGTKLPFKTWSQIGVCMCRLGLRGLAKSRCYKNDYWTKDQVMGNIGDMAPTGVERPSWLRGQLVRSTEGHTFGVRILRIYSKILIIL